MPMRIEATCIVELSLKFYFLGPSACTIVHCTLYKYQNALNPSSHRVHIQNMVKDTKFKKIVSSNSQFHTQTLPKFGSQSIQKIGIFNIQKILGKFFKHERIY